jgi:hypothetical protein
VERIDEQHANPLRTGKEMGSPTYPDRNQIGSLSKASELRREGISLEVHEGGVRAELLIRPHSVVAVTIEP